MGNNLFVWHRVNEPHMKTYKSAKPKIRGFGIPMAYSSNFEITDLLLNP